MRRVVGGLADDSVAGGGGRFDPALVVALTSLTGDESGEITTSGVSSDMILKVDVDHARIFCYIFTLLSL